MLFERQFDVQSDGFSVSVSATIPSFHYPRSATGDDTKSNFCNLLCNVRSHFIIIIVLGQSCRSKDGNTRSNLRHFLVTIHKFGHYAENHPAVFRDCLVPGFLSQTFLKSFIVVYHLNILSASTIDSGLPTSTKLEVCW
ncbi:hypothetical protein D3C86_1683420 [compost metagenome]